MSRRLGLALVLATMGALALRLPAPDCRPMHNDEAVNAIKLQKLWETGVYRYDPHEYHGPVLHYATLPALWLSGARDFAHVTEGTLRIVPVVFGVLLIPLLWLLADGLGRTGAMWAGVFTALSPAMVFYSRYFIHETLLVCFTLLLLAAGWRYARSRRAGWLILAGAAGGLMYATKETFVLQLAALAGAIGLALLWKAWNETGLGSTGNLPVPSSDSPDGMGEGDSPHTDSNLRRRNLLVPVGGSPTGAGDSPALPSSQTGSRVAAGLWNGRHILAAVAVAALVAIVFFTSFFTNAGGALDSIRTYLPWLNRAGGASPHIHPWYFYLERLLWFHHGRGPVWGEAVILVLAAVGGIAALRGKGLGEAQASLVRVLFFYTVLLTGIYSVIAYKTPWCLLGFLHGMILLAGVGAAVILRWPAWNWLRWPIRLCLVMAAGHLAWLAWQTSFIWPADRRNPYVYAQTSPDILELVEKVRAIAKVHPQGDQMVIKVMAPGGDYWPLPWYLRQFQQTGWWDTLPQDPFAPVIITGTGLDSGWMKASKVAYNTAGFFSLRPDTFVELYVEPGLWQRYLAAKRPGD